MSRISTAMLESLLEEIQDYWRVELSKEEHDQLDTICDRWEDKESIESEINRFILNLGYVFDEISPGECFWEKK